MIHEIASAHCLHGLTLRGGLSFSGDEYPPAKAVLMVGNAGAGYWRHFSHWRGQQAADIANPLDAWSRSVLDGIAAQVDARVLMPNDRPFAPFQQWAMRAEGLSPSPLGLLAHPGYGLWHAYRGALLFDRDIDIPAVEKPIHPCAACAGKPCLNACPVRAYTAEGFVYERCLAHVRGPDGAACRTGGCLARNACPVGVGYRYPAEVQAFHQKAFAGV